MRYRKGGPVTEEQPVVYTSPFMRQKLFVPADSM